MKLERINDFQIRCILDEFDIKENNLFDENTLKNPAKIKDFFEDILYKAKINLGFDVENSGVTIENNFSNDEQIVFIISKHSDKSTKKTNNNEIKTNIFSYNQNIKAFKFRNLEDIRKLAEALKNVKLFDNSLYIDENQTECILVVKRKNFDIHDFNILCNFFEEYGVRITSYVTEKFYDEHYILMIKNNAIQSINKYINKKEKKN